MRSLSTTHLALSCLLLLLASCGGGTAATRRVPADGAAVESGTEGLPFLAGLDALREAVAIQGHEIPVTEPTWERHTRVAGESLEFYPPANEHAYAVYRVDPPWGILLKLTGTGEGPLWLVAADYGTGLWVMEPFRNGYAEIDLTTFADPYSPAGYFYCGAVCPGGASGRLDTLSIEYDDLSEWDLNIEADEGGITLSWNELPVERYKVLRSTLPDDPAPYHVGTVVEEHAGGNSFRETVPEDAQGRWVPANNDNGTPDELSDDFPTIAPAVRYYYRLVPVLKAGWEGPPSPEVDAEVPWGERRTARRQWPDTTHETKYFAMRVRPREMTEAQAQWCAEHLVGAIGITQSGADRIRAYNPGFITLGQHWAHLVSPVYHGSFNFDFVYGDEVDDDDAWPYVDRHEEWFIHVPESEQPGNRVLCPGWPADIWWLEVDSVWKDYLGATTLKLLGEDHCDGWLIDGCHPRFGYSDQFWPGDLGDYWRPKMQAMLETVSTRAAQHELAPYIFADVWDWWANDLDVEDYAACDGIYLSEFIISWWYPFDPYGIERLEVVLDKLLAWQAQGKLTILNRNVGEVIGDRLICLACFHLVRGPRTYQLTGGDLDGAAPRWWPEYDFASGAPLGPQPTSAADLIAYDVYGKPYYRRDFEHCFAIVVTDTADGVQLADNVGYEILWPSGGGDPVDEDGNTSGSWEWQPWDSHFSWGGYIAREAPAGPGSR